MKIHEIDKFNVSGISVRTSNSNEMNPSTAKIGALWERFYVEFAPKLGQNSKVFGLYTNYQSDHNGEFDVVACSDSLEGDDVKQFQILSGTYLVFSGKGEMPQAIISLWGEVWDYFGSDNCLHTRTFTTDFEVYKDEQELEICIAVEP